MGQSAGPGSVSVPSPFAGLSMGLGHGLTNRRHFETFLRPGQPLGFNGCQRNAKGEPGTPKPKALDDTPPNSVSFAIKGIDQIGVKICYKQAARLIELLEPPGSYHRL